MAAHSASRKGASPYPGVASHARPTSSRWASTAASTALGPGSLRKWWARSREKS